MSYSVDDKKPKTRKAWIPSRRSATWWQLHKTRGIYAISPVVTPVDPDSFLTWDRIVNATIVEADGQPIALEAQLREDATERRVEVRWSEKYLGLKVRRRALIELRELE